VSVLVDTSILIDHLRGHQGASDLIERERSAGALHASEITRLEVLAGMRTAEHDQTQSLLAVLHWHSVDAAVAEKAGELGRAWLPSHRSMDAADLAIAATAILIDARLLTLNVRHFPMFSDLSRPY
jgi:predicted nucleic acid-binding protein